MEANGCCPEVGGTELVLVGSPWEGEAPAEPANPWEGEVTDQREVRTPEEGGAGRRGQFPGRIGFLPEMATLSRSGPYDYNPETPPRRHSSQFVMTLSVVPHAQPASAYSIARGTTLGGFVAGMVSPDTDRTDA